MSEWQLKSLAKVVELRRGFDLPTRKREPGPYPVLSAGVTAGWHSVGPVKGPGFVVGRATNLGVPTWCQTDFWPLNTTLYAADFKGNVPRFLFHLFESLDLSGYDSGSVQPMLNRNYIADIKVHVPPVHTQRAIAEVLGALDDKIAANDTKAAAALALAHALFRARDGSITREATLGDLVESGAIEFGDGYRTKKAEHGRPGYRILRVGDVHGDCLFAVGDDYVSREYAAQMGSKLSQAGDILLTTKGTVGRVAIVPHDLETVVYSPQLCYFRVADPAQIDPGYLAGWFRSAELERQTSERMYKSDMAPYINLRDVRSLGISLPPFEVQRAVGSTQNRLQQIFDRTNSESAALADARDDLLPLLMSGRIRVRDAEKRVEGEV